MLCPHCKTDLKISSREGIEIDYCPSCRGVWLDRGELDKIIERTNQYYEKDYKDYDDFGKSKMKDFDYDSDKRNYEHSKHRKKKSFFDNFFDFD